MPLPRRGVLSYRSQLEVLIRARSEIPWRLFIARKACSAPGLLDLVGHVLSESFDYVRWVVLSPKLNGNHRSAFEYVDFLMLLVIPAS